MSMSSDDESREEMRAFNDAKSFYRSQAGVFPAVRLPDGSSQQTGKMLQSLGYQQLDALNWVPKKRYDDLLWAYNKIVEAEKSGINEAFAFWDKPWDYHGHGVQLEPFTKRLALVARDPRTVVWVSRMDIEVESRRIKDAISRRSLPTRIVAVAA